MDHFYLLLRCWPAVAIMPVRNTNTKLDRDDVCALRHIDVDDTHTHKPTTKRRSAHGRVPTVRMPTFTLADMMMVMALMGWFFGGDGWKHLSFLFGTVHTQKKTTSNSRTHNNEKKNILTTPINSAASVPTTTTPNQPTPQQSSPISGLRFFVVECSF